MASQLAHDFLLNWIADHVQPVPADEHRELAKRLARDCLAPASVIDLSKADLEEAAGCSLEQLMLDALRDVSERQSRR